MADTTPQARPYHHGELRGALLEAGLEELRERGIEGFTLRSCARRAGVSHGAPAHHFADANALLTAMAALGFRRFLAAQAARKAVAAPSPPAQLKAAGQGYVDFALGDPDLFHLVFTSRRVQHDDPEFSAVAEAAFMQLVGDVGGVLGRNPFQRPEDMMVVSAVWAGVHGIADLLIGGRLIPGMMGMPAQDAMVDQLLDRLVDGVAAAV